MLVAVIRGPKGCQEMQANRSPSIRTLPARGWDASPQSGAFNSTGAIARECYADVGRDMEIPN